MPPLIAVQYSSPIRYRETTATKSEPVLLPVKSHVRALYGFYNLIKRPGDADGEPDGKPTSIMIRQEGGKEKDLHKWQKPLAEIKWHVEMF